jgi:hypothetical protein
VLSFAGALYSVQVLEEEMTDPKVEEALLNIVNVLRDLTSLVSQINARLIVLERIAKAPVNNNGGSSRWWGKLGAHMPTGGE